MLCTLASLRAPTLGPGSGLLLGRDTEPCNTERGHRSTGTWPSLKLLLDLSLETLMPMWFWSNLSPVLIQPKPRGLKEGGVRAVAGSLSCFPSTFGALCKDTVPDLGLNVSLPAWWKSQVPVHLLEWGADVGVCRERCCNHLLQKEF